MTKNGNASRMHKLVKEFRDSGLSQKEFAASHGLAPGKLHYWVSKTARPERSAAPKKDFVTISVTPEHEGRKIVIRLKSGIEIEIPVQMFALTTSQRFELYMRPTDMRKGFNGLGGLVANDLERSPDNGTVYIFINSARNKVKLLHWQSGGFVLYYMLTPMFRTIIL